MGKIKWEKLKLKTKPFPKAQIQTHGNGKPKWKLIIAYCGMGKRKPMKVKKSIIPLLLVSWLLSIVKK